MKKVKVFYSIFIFFLIQVSLSLTGYAQKVGDILEKGIPIKAKHAIFLRLNDKDNTLHFETGKTNSNNFDPLKESFFLLHGNGANVFLAPPLNPLSHSTSTDISFSNDEIDAKASEALGSIIDALAKLTTSPPTPSPNKNVKKKTAKNGDKNVPVVIKDISNPCDSKVLKLKASFEIIASMLKIDKKKELTEVFNILKKAEFKDKVVTKSEIELAKTKYTLIETYYAEIGTKIDQVKIDMKEYETCTPAPPDNFIKIFVMNQIIKQEQEVLDGYMTALKNLDNIYTLVKKVFDAAEGEGKEWQIKLGRVSIEEGKIATYTVTVNTDGYTLSEDNKEITKTAKKSVVATNLKFRKIQRIIPEVSAGLAFTYLKFPKYGTNTDTATGKQIVAFSGNDEFKRMNFTVMLNFNYYIPNSPVHPFWQVGIGATAGYPTFFTGFGGRINIAMKRLAVSGGFAGTWIKTLSTLKVGDPVSGTADLDKDIKYEFSFPLKPYLGIQYNF